MGNGIESCSIKTKSETQTLREANARDALLHGGTVDSFVRQYHANLRLLAFRAYVNAVRNALFSSSNRQAPPFNLASYGVSSGICGLSLNS